MKKALIAPLIAGTICISSTALAATPVPTYSDVPADHWAYVAVNELSRVGIVDGYGDNTFQGNKTMTRYEMAQVVEKAMENSNKATGKQKALIDKLAAEFALEINKIDTRVTKVEKFTQSTLKVGFDTLMTYAVDNPPAGKEKARGDEAFMSRVRLFFTGDLNDKTKFFARVSTSYGLAGMSNSTAVPTTTSNTNMYADMANLTFSNVLGFNSIRLGRQGINELGGNIIKKDGMDGIVFEKKMSSNTTLRTGALVPKVLNTAATAYDTQEIQFLSLISKANDNKFGVSGMYLNNNTTVTSTATSVGYTGAKVAGVSAYKKIGGWTLLGEYDRASLSGASSNAVSNPHAYLVQLTTGKSNPTTMFLNPQTMCDIFKPGDNAFTIAYHYLGAGVNPAGFSNWRNATATSLTNTTTSFTENVKGWAIDYQYTLMKGLAIDFTYQQLKYANTIGTSIAGNKVNNCFAIALQGRY